MSEQATHKRAYLMGGVSADEIHLIEADATAVVVYQHENKLGTVSAVSSAVVTQLVTVSKDPDFDEDDLSHCPEPTWMGGRYIRMVSGAIYKRCGTVTINGETLDVYGYVSWVIPQ